MGNIFSQNLGAKFLALLLAAGVWLYVISGESRLIDFPSSVPIQPRFTPEGLIAKLSTQDVKIRVLADRSAWRSLSTKSFNAYVDLTGLKQGTHLDIPVRVSTNAAGVEIKSISPSSVTVTLDPSVKKTVPVVVKIEGKAGEGLVPDDPKIEPEKVEVSGAKTEVDSIQEATATVRLNGETQDVSKTVLLEGFNAKGKEVSQITFSPSEAVVSIPIVKAGKTKTVGIKVVFSGTPKSGFWISQVSVDPASITITGNAEALADVKYIETRAVNIDGLEADKTLNGSLSPPTGIVIVEQIETIKVAVKISPIESTKEVVASLNPIGLSASLQMTDITANPVKVLVSGPASTLDTLTGNDVQISLDLSSYKTAGTYTVDVKKESITTPSGISAIRFNPSAITVKLENK